MTTAKKRAVARRQRASALPPAVAPTGLGITRSTPADGLPENLRVGECALWLHASRGVVYESIKSGALHAFRVGRLLRVRREDLIAFRNNGNGVS